MTTYTQFRALIVPAAKQATANAISHVLDPDTGGAETFRMGYSADGIEPVTHYVASVPLTEQTAALLDNPDAGPMFAGLQQLSAARGRTLAVTLAETQACRDSMIVSTLPLYDALDGLKRVDRVDSG